MNLWRRFRRWWLARNAPIQFISFPKCGRTWLQMMLSKVFELHFSVEIANPLKLRDYHKQDSRIPWIYGHHDGGPEFLRPDQLSTDKSKYRNSKVVFLVRDPRDVLVSSYFQKTRRNINFAGTLDAYIEETSGSLHTNIVFYNIWLANRDVPKGFLLISYEDMRENPASVLRRVLDFIDLAEVSDAVVDQAVALCTFDKMKKQERSGDYGTKSLTARDASDETTFKTRKGEVGGYKEYLTPEQEAYIDQLIATELTDALPAYHRIKRIETAAVILD